MKKKLRIVFFIALLTGFGVIFFQSYWLYNVYQLNRERFVKTASAALQRSVDNYYLLNFVPGQLQPPLSLMEVDKDSIAHARPASLDSSRIDVKGFELLMAQAMFLLKNKPLELDSIAANFKTELGQEGIELSFTLAIADHILSPVSAYVGVSGKSSRVYATFSGSGGLVLARSAAAIAVAFLLAGLTAGCLWYMLRIIGQQRRLDIIKNDFINNMTHELRTPVALLKTTHEALIHFGVVGDSHKTLRYLQMNERELKSLEAKVDRLLDIARLENNAVPAELEWVNLKSILMDVTNRYLPTNVTLHLDYRLGDRLVQTDAYGIDVIASNLVDNAIKYSREQGGQVDIVVEEDGAGWILEVRDNGIGIPEEYLPQIFEKFFRVPKGKQHDVKGYGIGLSYVREMVRTLGGTIEVRSKVGAGTSFTLKFPSWTK